VRIPAQAIALSDVYLYALSRDQIAIFDARATAEPVALRTYHGLQPTSGIVVDGMRALVTSAGDGPDVVALDLTAPDLPYELENIGQTGHTYRARAAAGLIILPAGFAGLRLFSLTEGGALLSEGSYSSPPAAAHLAIDGSYLLAGGQSGWSVVDSAASQAVGAADGLPVRGLAANGETVAVAAGDAGVALYSVVDPGRPKWIAQRDTTGPADGVALDARFVYVADSAGLEIYDRLHLAQTQRVTLPAPATGVALAGGAAYVSLSDGSLAVIDLGDPQGGLRVVGSAGTARPTALISGPDGAIYGLADTQISRLALGDLKNPAAISAGVLPQVGERGFFVNDLLVVLTPGEAVRLYDPATIASGAASYGEIPLSAIDIAADWPLGYAAYGEGGLGLLDLASRQTPPPFYTQPVVGLHRSGDTLFAVGSALTAWDISQRDHPRLLASLPLDFPGRHVDPAPGNDLLIGTQSGLVIAHWDGGTLAEVGSLVVPDAVDRALQIGRRGYLALHGGGLLVIDLSDPAHPASLVSMSSRSGQFVHDLLKLDDAHLLVSWEGGVDVLDVSAPAATPRLVQTSPVGAQAVGITMASDSKHAALALGSQGAAIVDLSDPRQPVIVGRVDTPGDGLAARLEANTLFVADGRCGLRVFDAADVSAPREVGYWRGSYASDVLVIPGGTGQPLLAVADGSQIAELRYNPSAPAAPPPVPQSPDPGMDVSDAPISLKLEWGPPADSCSPLSYDVYFGQESNPPLLGTVTGDPRIEVPQLSPRSTYTWRVEAGDAQGDRAGGPTWRFTTAGADYPNAYPPSPPLFLAWIEEHPLVSGALIGLLVAIPAALLLRGILRPGAAGLARKDPLRREDIPDWYSTGGDDSEEPDEDDTHSQ
jgi:hypothetical protein